MRSKGKTTGEVRAHSQEREWLLNLGNGDIVEGAQSVIKQIMSNQTTKRDLKDKGSKHKK